ncbi:MAG: hypothetical protein AB1750_15865, partial [Chloroflexota bacterium]
YWINRVYRYLNEILSISSLGVKDFKKRNQLLEQIANAYFMAFREGFRTSLLDKETMIKVVGEEKFVFWIENPFI